MAGEQYRPERQTGAQNLLVSQTQQQPDEAAKRAGNRWAKG